MHVLESDVPVTTLQPRFFLRAGKSRYVQMTGEQESTL